MSDDSEDVATPSCGHSSYIGHVVDELISTERAYVNDLRDVVRVSSIRVTRLDLGGGIFSKDWG